jgi:hypothetical protein
MQDREIDEKPWLFEKSIHMEADAYTLTMFSNFLSVTSTGSASKCERQHRQHHLVKNVKL